jgi:hypothetical protein
MATTSRRSGASTCCSTAEKASVFLVDSEGGWSWVKPLTGAPQLRGDVATWANKTYRQRERYDAKVTWVLGEFYWRVRRDEVARVTDYVGTGAASQRRLSSERTAAELTWSEGAVLDAQAIARAFRLAPAVGPALQRSGAGAPSTLDGGLLKVGLIVAVVVAVLMIGFCSSRDSDCADVRATFGEASSEYQQCAQLGGGGTGFRTGGGSYGGYSAAVVTNENAATMATLVQQPALEVNIMGLEWLKPGVVLGTILYAVIGVAVLWISFMVIDKLTPTSCGKRFATTRTWHWPSWWPRCSWPSARSWRQRSTVSVRLDREAAVVG